MADTGEIFAFLELEGVEGESTDSKYNKHLAPQSVGWGATNSGTYSQGSGPSSQSKGQLHDISFSKYMCKASLRLLELALTGKPVKNGTLSLVKGSDKTAYFQVKLEDVLVTAFHMSANGGILPMESCTISYVVAKPEYKVQENDGTASSKVHWGWNTQK